MTLRREPVFMTGFGPANNERVRIHVVTGSVIEGRIAMPLSMNYPWIRLYADGQLDLIWRLIPHTSVVMIERVAEGESDEES